LDYCVSDGVTVAVSSGFGVGVMVGVLTCVWVVEGVCDPDNVEVGDSVRVTVSLGVTERVSVGVSEGSDWVGGGWFVGDGRLVRVGEEVLGFVVGSIVPGVLVVFKGGSSMGVEVLLCPPVWSMGFHPCWFQK
jgi:hypothetical protein